MYRRTNACPSSAETTAYIIAVMTYILIVRFLERLVETAKTGHSMIGSIFMIAQIHADCTASRYIQRFCFPPDGGYF